MKGVGTKTNSYMVPNRKVIGGGQTRVPGQFRRSFFADDRLTCKSCCVALKLGGGKSYANATVSMLSVNGFQW